jgi:hypothetical protein
VGEESAVRVSIVKQQIRRHKSQGRRHASRSDYDENAPGNNLDRESVSATPVKSARMYNTSRDATPAGNLVKLIMNKLRNVRFLLSLALVLALSGMLFAQSTDKILVVNGKTAGAPVRQIDGRSYVDIEALAQVTNGIFTVEPNRIVLTIPSPDAGTTANTSAQPPQRLSRDFSAAAVAELAQMREWRVALRAMVKYGLAVSDAWVQDYHEQSLVGLRQAEVAATTDADRAALQLLRGEGDMLTSWANGVNAARQALNGASTVDPNALQNDTALAKIRNCNQFLNSMIVSGAFADDPSCH